MPKSKVDTDNIYEFVPFPLIHLSMSTLVFRSTSTGKQAKEFKTFKGSVESKTNLEKITEKERKQTENNLQSEVSKPKRTKIDFAKKMSDLSSNGF